MAKQYRVKCRVVNEPLLDMVAEDEADARAAATLALKGVGVRMDIISVHEIAGQQDYEPTANAAVQGEECATSSN